MREGVDSESASRENGEAILLVVSRLSVHRLALWLP
jgi:hypothetical protein